jgi:hypothetical protein
MNDQQSDNIPKMPPGDLKVDYGSQQPGSSNPMPAEQREAYQSRIRNVVEAQAAGAQKAAKLFIR